VKEIGNEPAGSSSNTGAESVTLQLEDSNSTEAIEIQGSEMVVKKDEVPDSEEMIVRLEESEELNGSGKVTLESIVQLIGTYIF
jgi:hypothetical protein